MALLSKFTCPHDFKAECFGTRKDVFRYYIEGRNPLQEGGGLVSWDLVSVSLWLLKFHTLNGILLDYLQDLIAYTCCIHSAITLYF